MKNVRCGVVSAVLVAACCAGAARGEEGWRRRLVDREEYGQRLRAFWLGQCIANWTGLRTEAWRTTAPFFTDVDWGTTPAGMPQPIVFVTWGNPWGADDDTDIEYVYQHLMAQHGTVVLSREQIAAGWAAHINSNIWVSNASARQLMGRGVLPPATGLFTPNANALMIDAQLTTEFFGLYAPGSVPMSMRASDLPIRTTAAGYAAHASQFFVALHALAATVDRSLAGREQAEWLVNEARKVLPAGSKSADIVDFVLADYLANPDVNDWERTRDLVHQRYQVNAAANGFVYRAWYESSVNFACGVIALLYGGMDYQRTVQIGTLSGWDSDNGTSTMGGLVAFVIGHDALRAAFPGVTLLERYWIYRTRENLPDYLPGDAQAEDTFSMMAARMLPLVEMGVTESGGLIDAERGLWLLPPAVTGDVVSMVPTAREYARSANNRVRREGGTVTASASVVSSPWCCGAFGFASPSYFANGAEQDFSGAEQAASVRGFWSSQNSGVAPGGSLHVSVVYDRVVEVAKVRLIEGEHFSQSGLVGGWFESCAVEARIGGVWTAVSAVQSEALDSARPYQIIDFDLVVPVMADGVRVVGTVGGAQAFVTVLELDALAAAAETEWPSFDVNADGRRDAEDLLRWHESPVDLDGDGAADESDRAYLQEAVRWLERVDVAE